MLNQRFTCCRSCWNIKISRILAFLPVLTPGFALSIKRDAATVEADLDEISRQTTDLDNSIKGYDGTLKPALVCTVYG